MPPVTPEGLLLQRIAETLDAIHDLLAAGKTAGSPEDEGRVEVRGAATPRPASSGRRTRRK